MMIIVFSISKDAEINNAQKGDIQWLISKLP